MGACDWHEVSHLIWYILFSRIGLFNNCISSDTMALDALSMCWKQIHAAGQAKVVKSWLHLLVFSLFTYQPYPLTAEVNIITILDSKWTSNSKLFCEVIVKQSALEFHVVTRKAGKRLQWLGENGEWGVPGICSGWYLPKMERRTTREGQPVNMHQQGQGYPRCTDAKKKYRWKSIKLKSPVAYYLGVRFRRCSSCLVKSMPLRIRAALFAV